MALTIYACSCELMHSLIIETERTVIEIISDIENKQKLILKTKTAASEIKLVKFVLFFRFSCYLYIIYMNLCLVCAS